MRKLAINGGPKVLNNTLPAGNTIGEQEVMAAVEVIRTGNLSGFVGAPGPEFNGGKQVRNFEENWAERFQAKHAVSVNSATSAIYMALLAVGVSPGDEVIVPPYTMSATPTSVLFANAIPVFADIHPDTFTLDPGSVRSRITSATKAIIVVNLFGGSAHLDELSAICKEYKLALIEDNAQAAGTIFHGKYCGTIGDIGVFSLNRHKSIQSGEGGLALTNDNEYARRMQLVRNHGENCLTPDLEDISNSIGLNFRMTEIEAAIANEQLKKLDAVNEERIRLADYLSDQLRGVEGLIPPYLLPNSQHVYHLYPIKFEEQKIGLSRDLFCKAVQAEGFYLRAGYLEPLYLNPIYQRKIAFGKSGHPFSLSPNYEKLNYSRGICPVVERVNAKEMMLTNLTRPGVQKKDIDLFVLALRKVIENKHELS